MLITERRRQAVDTRLAGRSVLVTGGTRGIGRAIALAYGREGARVATTYASDEAAAAETAALLERNGTEAAFFHLDLEDSASIEAAVERTVAHFGGLDALVANAVRWPLDAQAPLAESDPADWTRALRANLEGTALTARTSLPHLARSSAGRMVMISSGVSRQGFAGATPYGAAKAALEGLVASLKWEAGAAGVLVNIVSPGFTLTEHNLASFGDDVRESVRERTPSGRLSLPDDIANAVLLLGSPANGNISGAYLPVGGGID
jgi:NAD(P)-dependent dehydrogenase (short-subunit alcohol dehydrogenase family)